MEGRYQIFIYFFRDVWAEGSAIMKLHRSNICMHADEALYMWEKGLVLVSNFATLKRHNFCI